MAAGSCRDGRVTQIRLDAGTVSSVRRTPQGGLRVDARLTRVGVLDYRNADGSVRREFRPPDEVFKAESLDTLRGAPVTDLHPSEMVRTDNHAVLARGHVGDDVRADERFVAATLYVQDSRLVEMVERGDRREISCGYTCDFDATPGEYEGERYDGVQRNITYNHAALGPREWGRAGSDVALRMDAADVWTSTAPAAGEEQAMKNKRKDEGEQPPVPAADAPPAEDKPTQDAPTCEHCGAPVNEEGKFAAPVVVAEDSAPVAEEKMDAKHRARVDSLEAEVTNLRRRLDEANDPKRIGALVAEAVAVRQVAARAGIERADSMSTADARRAVVEKVLGLRCDGKSGDYVAASFDAAVKVLERDGVSRARSTFDTGTVPGVGIIDGLRGNAEQHVRLTNHEKGGR